MKKKRLTISKLVKMAYKETKRSSLAIYLILRFLVIVCMVLQLLKGNINNALLCLLSLILLFAPLFIQNKFAITLPSGLEITIYFFIFAAEILGEINNFYGIIKNVNLSPFYLCLVAFCFSMTIGVLWEFFEYSSDKFFDLDMQKDTVVKKISSVTLNPSGKNKAIVVSSIGKTVIYDENGYILETIDGGYLDIGLNDTMKDLLVNFIGAVVFCSFAYLALKQNKKNNFIDKFIPTKEKRPMASSVIKEIEDRKELLK